MIISRQMRLIARREVTERFRSRGLWIMTALTALFVVGLVILPTLINSTPKPTVIALVGADAQALAPGIEHLASASGVLVEVTSAADAQEARAAIESGSAQVSVALANAGAEISVGESLDPAVQAIIQGSLNDAHMRQALADAGIPLEDVLPALTPVPVTVTAISPPPVIDGARSTAAFAAGFLLYLTLAVYGGAIANGVAQEKTSRTAEVLLATARPGDLLAGKVLGIGIASCVQMGIMVGAGIITNVVVGGLELSGVGWAVLPATLLWFVLGFALYAIAYAAAGAVVARQEEVQFSTVPLTMPLLLGYFLVYAVIFAPGSWWLAVLSMLPPLAPVVMPARIGFTDVPAWQVALAIVLMLGAIWGAFRLATRVYANAYLQGGSRMKWKFALRSRKSG